MRGRAHLFAVLAIVAAFGIGCDDGYSDGNNPDGEPVQGGLVEDYCSYGAVSEAQLEGCIDHVAESDVDAYDTNAARYARGQLDECLSDAGPFCEER